MPLIDVTMRPGYQLLLDKVQGIVLASSDVTRTMVKHHLARALPDLVVANSADLGLEPGTPADAVQVTNHDYGPDDANIVDIWIKVLLTEDPPERWRRQQISTKLYDVIFGWFALQELLPHDIFIDVLWVPASGIGSINGKAIRY